MAVHNSSDRDKLSWRLAEAGDALTSTQTCRQESILELDRPEPENELLRGQAVGGGKKRLAAVRAGC